MVIWILAVICVAASVVYNWAELGQRLQGRRRWMLWVWPGLALLVWQLALQQRIHGLIALALLLAVLGAGHLLLRRGLPPREKALPKRRAAKKRGRKAH